VKSIRHISRRDLIKSCWAASAMDRQGSGLTKSVEATKRLANVGWSWEGQGIVGGVGYGGSGLSIFGVGEGAEYFGLRRVLCMFQSNNEAVLEKLRHFEEVICEVSPHRPRRCGNDDCVQLHYDPSPTKFLEEARNIAELSLRYPNIKGAYIDDLLGRPARKPNAITPGLCSSISGGLKSHNPNLKLWAPVFINQLYEEDYAGFKSHMDVINLGMWAYAKEVSDIDRHLDRCREVFPNRPIMLGTLLWEFTLMKPVPMDLLRPLWERLLKYVQAGKIDGYTILGAYLIDAAEEQARWIRDFIAAN